MSKIGDSARANLDAFEEIARTVNSERPPQEEFVVINGHAPWCAYIRNLGDLFDDQDCDCVGWDDDDEDYYEDDDLAYEGY